MTREQAIEIAQMCAKAKPQGYYAEPFMPHEWVIDAIMMADTSSDLPIEVCRHGTPSNRQCVDCALADDL